MADWMDSIIDTYVEVWNTGNTDLLDDIVTPDVTRNAASAETTNAEGIDSLKSAMTNFRKAFPDTRVTIKQRAYGDNYSLLTWEFEGTNTGPGEFPATGKAVKVSGATVATFRDGRMAQEDVYFDNLSLMIQLGFQIQEPATA